MAKLFYYFGAMNASKSAQLIMTDYNYLESGKKTLIFKPDLDSRDGGWVKSRALGEKTRAVVITKQQYNVMFDLTKSIMPQVVLVDEVQFLETHHIDELRKIVNELNIAVLGFGLRTDFQGNLFVGAKRMMELADEIIQIKTMCRIHGCNRLAQMNMRVINNQPIFHGEQVQTGGNESYLSVCNNHFMEAWKKAYKGSQ